MDNTFSKNDKKRAVKIAHLTYYDLIKIPQLSLTHKIKFLDYDVKYFNNYENKASRHLITFAEWNPKDEHPIICMNTLYLSTANLLKGFFVALMFNTYFHESHQDPHENYFNSAFVLHTYKDNSKLSKICTYMLNICKTLELDNRP